MPLEKEIYQAFQEHIIRGRSFTVQDIRSRVETLLASDPPGERQIDISVGAASMNRVRNQIWGQTRNQVVNQV